MWAWSDVAGTMTFGEQNTFEDACHQPNMAREEGVNFSDAAEMYPVSQRAETQGRTEEYVGRWLRECKVQRGRVVVAATATGPSGQMIWNRGVPLSQDQEAIEGSLKRLGTDYIGRTGDATYVPMFGDTDYDPSCSYSSVCIEEQFEALGLAVREGKIRNVGMSNETAYRVVRFCRLAEQNTSLPRISTIQWMPGRYAEAECRYSLTKPNVLPPIKAYVEMAQRYNLSRVSLAFDMLVCLFQTQIWRDILGFSVSDNWDYFGRFLLKANS